MCAFVGEDVANDGLLLYYEQFDKYYKDKNVNTFVEQAN